MSIKVDSYAFESNMHFPTDLNLAWDCARKCIELSALPMDPTLEVSLSELRGYHDLRIHHIFLISDRLLGGRKIAPSFTLPISLEFAEK